MRAKRHAVVEPRAAEIRSLVVLGAIERACALVESNTEMRTANLLAASAQALLVAVDPAGARRHL
jgi:hypothetical protein